MAQFKNICLLKAPQALDLPDAQNLSDLTELCYLAGNIKENVESVSIPVDFYRKNDFERFIKFLKKNPVDLVGISTMTGAYNNALKLAEIAKRFDKYVVFGGYHPSALPEDVLKSSYVDAVVIGEGEATFKDLVINGPSEEVPGIAFKKNGGIVTTKRRPLIKNLDTLPHPLRSIRPVRFGEPGTDYSIDTIFTSRGCPWNCSFCANDTVNRNWRARSPENVIEEIAQIHDPKRKKTLKIWDANFLTDVNRVEKLCDLMLENNFTNFKIWTETRVKDIVRAEKIMPKLKKVGFRNVALGIESPNDETLRLMNKKNANDDVVEAVEILRRHRIKSQGYFIVGHYTETVEDTKRYPEFAKSLGLRQAYFMVMTPYPGTKVYEENKKEDKIIDYNWDLYNNFCTVVATKGMDTATLKKMNTWCYGKFYVDSAFFTQRKILGVTGKLLQMLIMQDLLLKVGKTNTRKEREDNLYLFLSAGIGDYIREEPKKPSIFLNVFKEFTIRFRHFSGKCIDFTFTRLDNKRKLHVNESFSTEKIKGISIDIGSIVSIGKHFTASRAIVLTCQSEIARNLKLTPRLKLKKIVSLAFNKDIISIVFFASCYLLPILARNTASLTWAFIKNSRKK